MPEFYDRDADGVPRRWLARIRESMARLTPVFSSTRMVREYVEQAYLPAAAALRSRTSDGCVEAGRLADWADHIEQRWPGLHVGSPSVSEGDGVWNFTVPVSLGELKSDEVLVELYANPSSALPSEAIPLRQDHAIPGAVNGFIYAAEIPATRASGDYTVRAVPRREGVFIPAELPLILWQR